MSKFLKWLDNYWYHYKWHTIIVAFFLIIGIISTVQIFNRETYEDNIEVFVKYMEEHGTDFTNS